MISDRRALLQGAASTAFALTLPSTASANTAKKIFMIDAVNDIKRKAGMPADTAPSIGDAPRKGAPVPRKQMREGTPYRFGGVCVPTPFADFDFWYTDGATSWFPNQGQKLPAVTVPHGFCCDLTSIPQFFWSFGLPKTGRYAYAAIVHDYLYWDQTIATMEQADEILYTGMIDSGVGTITREAINIGVSKVPYFSRDAWNKNTELKKAGVRRILKNFPPRDKMISWAEWSKNRSNFQ